MDGFKRQATRHIASTLRPGRGTHLVVAIQQHLESLDPAAELVLLQSDLRAGARGAAARACESHQCVLQVSRAHCTTGALAARGGASRDRALHAPPRLKGHRRDGEAEAVQVAGLHQQLAQLGVEVDHDAVWRARKSKFGVGKEATHGVRDGTALAAGALAWRAPRDPSGALGWRRATGRPVEGSFVRTGCLRCAMAAASMPSFQAAKVASSKAMTLRARARYPSYTCAALGGWVANPHRERGEACGRGGRPAFHGGRARQQGAASSSKAWKVDTGCTQGPTGPTQGQ